jgi:hypothetical protein
MREREWRSGGWWWPCGVLRSEGKDQNENMRASFLCSSMAEGV